MKPQRVSKKGPSPSSSQKKTSVVVSGGSNRPSRRPIRPLDRLKMKDWLLRKLQAKDMEGLLWWVDEGTVFAVKWPHASAHGFLPTEDARLWKAWAQHSGIHQDGDVEDHKRWKSNFRCAIHSLLDVEEITRKGGRRGNNAARTYRILDTPRAKKTKSRQPIPSESSEEEGKEENEDSDSGASTTADTSNCIPLTVASISEGSSADHGTENVVCNMPNFQCLGVSTTGLNCVQYNLHSGGSMTIKQEPQHLLATPLISEPITISELSPSFPIPTNVVSPADLVEREERGDWVEEDMRVVGIRVVPRHRTPSGDSGLPASPIKEEITITALEDVQDISEAMDKTELTELENAFVPDIILEIQSDPSNIPPISTPVTPAMPVPPMTSAMPVTPMTSVMPVTPLALMTSVTPVMSMTSLTSVMPMTSVASDIPTVSEAYMSPWLCSDVDKLVNAPEPAMMMEVSTCGDDFNLSSLDLQDLQDLIGISLHDTSFSA